MDVSWSCRRRKNEKTAKLADQEEPQRGVKIARDRGGGINKGIEAA